MNDQTLAAAPGRVTPPAQWTLRFGIASTIGLLLFLCLFMAGRRIGGAFDQPLSAATILLLGAGMAALAACLRLVWPRAAVIDSPLTWARLLLPSLALFLFCYALSLPGSAPWAVALLWFLVVGEEGAWWLADGLAWQSHRRHGPPAGGSSTASASPLLHAEADLFDEVSPDMTQQMTRLRDVAGGDLIFGQARAEFVIGERSQSIHLAFCPPLTAKPQITVMQADGPAAAITVAQAESFGARFEIRLAATTRSAETITVEFEVRAPLPQQPPSTTSAAAPSPGVN